MPRPPKTDADNKKSNANEYLKYSGMAIQMGVLIFLGTFAGIKIDERMGNDPPWATLIGSLIGIAAAFYLTLKDFFVGKK